MNEDVAKIVYGYVSLILCGTFSVCNKLNINEQLDFTVFYIKIGFI
jgi:hypothetical protein